MHMCRQWANGADLERLPGRPQGLAWAPAGLCGSQRRTLPGVESQDWSVGCCRDGVELGLRPIQTSPG